MLARKFLLYNGAKMTNLVILDASLNFNQLLFQIQLMFLFLFKVSTERKQLENTASLHLFIQYYSIIFYCIAEILLNFWYTVDSPFCCVGE